MIAFDAGADGIPMTIQYSVKLLVCLREVRDMLKRTSEEKLQLRGQGESGVWGGVDIAETSGSDTIIVIGT
jgi:hypothetical protein